ncbi:MAG: helix-turn-helix transcriptional regulator [Chloroflexi bacterium]|nr:helix-turn-helix transcriptional regulator [Chloroflexota bacterium]
MTEQYIHLETEWREAVVDEDEPSFVISVAARIVGMHVQTLRYYERAGLLSPTRSPGNIRLYSQADIARLRQIRRLTEELGLNLAGVEVILRMSERLARLDAEVRRLQQENEGLRRALVQTRRTQPSRGAQ